MYYIGAKFIIVKKMFWHTNNAFVPIQPGFKCYSGYQLSFKIIQFIIYILALTFGVFGLLKLIYEKKISLVFLAVPLIIVFLFAELRTTQARYISQVYIVLLWGIPTAFVTLFSMLNINSKESR